MNAFNGGAATSTDSRLRHPDSAKREEQLNGPTAILPRKARQSGRAKSFDAGQWNNHTKCTKVHPMTLCRCSDCSQHWTPRHAKIADGFFRRQGCLSAALRPTGSPLPQMTSRDWRIRPASGCRSGYGIGSILRFRCCQKSSCMRPARRDAAIGDDVDLHRVARNCDVHLSLRPTSCGLMPDMGPLGRLAHKHRLM